MRRFKERFLRMDDRAQIAAWDSGGTKTAIVFVHGFPENHHCWEPLLKALPASVTKEHRIIIYDLRGFGRSSKIGDASLLRFYHDHEAIVSQLQLPRYHIVGHDWGGAVALHVSRFRPQSIRSMAILNTNYWKTDLKGMWHLIFLNLPVIPDLAFRLVPGELYRLGIVNSFINPDRLSPDAEESYLEMFRDRETTSYWIRLYNNMAKKLLLGTFPFLKSFFNDDSKGLKRSDKAYQVPATIIWGREDRFNPVRIGKDIVGNLRKRSARVSWHPVPHAGHFVQEEKPKDVAKYLVEHWKGL